MKEKEITSLQRGTKSKNINIYIDGEYSFSVVDSTVVDFKLFKGKKLNEQEIRGIVKKDIESRFYYKAIDRILSRPRSEYEIKKYIQNKLKKYKYQEKIDESVIDEIIDRLKNSDYLNDYKFAQWWIENRTTFKSRSRLELQMELSTKGIKPEIIEQVIKESLDTELEIQMARDLVEKQKTRLKNKKMTEIELTDRIKKYLQRKGYNWEIIKQVI